jgi:hypothetical protein
MADEIEELEQESIEIETETADDAAEDENGSEESDEVTDEEAEQSDESEDDEITVTVDGESPPQDDEEEKAAPKWVKDLRKKHVEAQRRIKELESKLEKPQNTAPQPSKKPTLEDFDYDAEQFEAAYDQWKENERALKEQQAKREQEQEARNKEWQDRLATYGKLKASLKVRDFDSAEQAVLDRFDVTQQGVIVSGADNPALVIYYLGRNDARAEELSAIKDPVKFAFAIAKLEPKLKVTSKKSPPPPEKSVSGAGRTSGTLSSQLASAQAKAEKTGDYSDVFRIKRELKAAARK